MSCFCVVVICGGGSTVSDTQAPGQKSLPNGRGAGLALTRSISVLRESHTTPDKGLESGMCHKCEKTRHRKHVKYHLHLTDSVRCRFVLDICFGRRAGISLKSRGGGGPPPPPAYAFQDTYLQDIESLGLTGALPTRAPLARTAHTYAIPLQQDSSISSLSSSLEAFACGKKELVCICNRLRNVCKKVSELRAAQILKIRNRQGIHFLSCNGESW